MKRAAVAAAVVWSAVLVAWGPAAAQEVPAVPVPPTPPAAPAAEKQGLPSMKPEGTLFQRYWYMVQDREKEDPGVDEPHANSFELWRGYFGARGQLLPWLTFRFTSDVGAEKTPKTSEAAAHVHGTGAEDETTEAAGDHTHAVAAETRYELFVKYAWLQAELTDGLSLRAGVVDNPYHEFVDRYWGCRYVSRNAGDEFGLWNTADVGWYLRYAVGDKLGEVALGMVNGGGYKQAADTDENKNLWFYAMFTPFRPLGGMGERLSFGAWTEHTLVFSEHLDHPTVMSAFAGYKDSWDTRLRPAGEAHVRGEVRRGRRPGAVGAGAWGVPPAGHAVEGGAPGALLAVAGGPGRRCVVHDQRGAGRPELCPRVHVLRRAVWRVHVVLRALVVC